MVDATDADNQIPSIEPDEFQIAYDATKRLIQADCKRIAYIGCSENMIAQDGRFAGYQAALQDSGFAYDPSLVCNVLNNGPALRAVDKLFDEPQFPTVSFASMMRAMVCVRMCGTPRTDRRQGRFHRRRRQPPRVRRNAGTAADHGGTAPL